MMEIHHLLMPV